MDQDRTEKELVADPTLYEAGRDGNELLITNIPNECFR